MTIIMRLHDAEDNDVDGWFDIRRPICTLSPMNRLFMDDEVDDDNDDYGEDEGHDGGGGCCQDKSSAWMMTCYHWIPSAEPLLVFRSGR